MENEITLDGTTITLEQLNERKSNLHAGERIVETSPNHYETITRIQG